MGHDDNREQRWRNKLWLCQQDVDLRVILLLPHGREDNAERSIAWAGQHREIAGPVVECIAASDLLNLAGKEMDPSKYVRAAADLIARRSLPVNPR